MSVRLPLWIALLLLPLAACASQARHWVELGGERYLVELAADERSRAQGLMFREHLEPGRGMLFIHESERPQQFWMKNTLIPLDILHFDAQRRLVSISHQVPPCPQGTRCPLYPSLQPALYTLELNAGEAARLGVQPGDALVIGPPLLPTEP